ncbi:MAG: amino acid adenylation domain-containing protein, partial [Okeania sp. SIO2D1]|nr:amino acid adenylation domain-containing protein [Okeania sp. SIO2D1]
SQDKCIHQLFEEQVERTPDAVAVVFEDRQLTYHELNCQANQLAHYLQTLGVAPEVLVGICVERSVEMVVGLLGILKAGGAYVPLDPNYPTERIAYMLEDSSVPVLLTQSKWVEKLPSSVGKLILLDSDWDVIASLGQDNPVNQTKPDHLVYVIYTSGSTGKPKGVAVTHLGINRLVNNTNYINLASSDRVAQTSNASFDAATFEIWGALLHGAQLIGVPQQIALEAEKFVALLRKYQVSVLFLTTALFNQLAALVPEAFKSLRYLLFGAETVDPTSVKKVLEHGAPEKLLHVYGPAENTTFSSWYLVENVRQGATTIPIGRPISNTQVYILDKQLQPVPIGIQGELHIGGDGLARGYLNRRELTEEKFIPNPFDKSKLNNQKSKLYKTGDLARYLPDGNIEYLGRIDHQVKIRGFRIELGEIEAVLAQHSQVREAVVIAREDIPGDKRLVAYLVPNQEKTRINDLRSFLKIKLPEYMIPAAFVLLESIPLTPI